MPGRWAAGLLLLTLLGCSSGAGSPSTSPPGESPAASQSTTSGAADATGVPNAASATKGFDAIAVLGHSGATGVASDPTSPLEDARANSWATGDNPAVDSVYQRFLRAFPAVEGHAYNLAVNGADIDQMIDQARLLPEVDGPLPDLVLVQGIDGDMRCDGTDARNVPRFARKVERLVRIVRRGNDSARVFIVSQWGTPRGWAEAVSGIDQVVADNTGDGPCDLFDERGRISDAGVEGIERISRLYYGAMAAVCSRTPRCWADRGAAGTIPVTPALLGADHNHLSVAGHAALASVTWQALPHQLTDPR